MSRMNVLNLCALLLFISNCNRDKKFGYDYSFKIANITKDSIYVGYEMNYDKYPNNFAVGEYLLMPSALNPLGTLGEWDDLFTKESDSIIVYFIKKDVYINLAFDSIISQKKYHLLKKFSQSQFINNKENITFP
jgi:hypothetical protein